MAPVKSQDLTGQIKKRAAVPPRDNWNFFSLQSSPHGTTGFFFLDRKNPDLGAGSAGGFYAGQVARPGFYAGQECGALGIEASDAGQECDARKHKWHLCF